MVLALLSSLILSLQEPEPLPPSSKNMGIFSVNWSPDGSKLVYGSLELGDPPKYDIPKASLTIVNADGSGSSIIPLNGVEADFTSDGKELIVSHFESQQHPQLYRYDIVAQKSAPLTPTEWKASAPSCSPTEDWILFNSDKDGDDLQIYKIHKDATGLVKLTHGPGKAYNPKWSPDGKRVVYYRELGNNKDQIYTMAADGSDEKHISKDAEHNYYPAYRPNGFISFTNVVKPREQRLVTVDAAGEFKSLFPYETFMLRWSPSGDKAAFIAGPRGKAALYVTDAEGKHPVNVSG